MKKSVRILIIIASSIMAIVLIIALIISPVAQNYVVKHSKELTGRKIAIKNLHLNIFTGTLELDSFTLFEANDKDVFASIDTFFVGIKLTELLSKKLELTELKVINPYLEVLQNDSIFNFSDLTDKFTGGKDTTKSEFPKSIIIKNIYMRGGRLIYTDQQLRNIIKMKDLGVAIPELRFGKGDTKGGVHLQIGDFTTIDSKLTLDMTSRKYLLNLNIRNLDISIAKPYVQEYFNVYDFEGLVNGNIAMTGQTNHFMNFHLNGTADGHKLKMTNSLKEPLFTAKSASVKIKDISEAKSSYLFDYIHASGVTLDFIMHPDPRPNNMMAIFKPENPNDTTKSSLIFKVGDLHLDNSQINFTDNTMRPSFKLKIENVDFKATNFDLDGVNDINTRGTFPHGGLIHFAWKGNRNDFSNQKIMVNMRNFGLKLVSPYCKYYTAFDITSGNMNFASKTNIRNSNLESSNSVDVYKMNVSKKHKELKPKYNVPLRLALYVMKDKDDKINFNLPVKGNMKDPKFSYSKIIWQTMLNLLVKVALAPVKFLAGTLGMNPDKLQSIQTDVLQTTLTAEQYSQLTDLAEIVRKKPDMQLTLTQFVDMDNVLPDYAVYKMKYNYLKSVRQSNDTTRISSTEIINTPVNQPAFVHYLDSVVTEAGKPLKNISIVDKSLSLFVTDSLKADLMKRMERKNNFIRNYMVTTLQIPEKNILVKTAPVDSLKTYTGETEYKIGMTLP